METDVAQLDRLGSGIFELVACPLLLTDTDGRVVAANDTLASTAALPKSALVGRTLHDVFADPPERVDEVLGMWLRSADRRPAGLSMRRGGADPVATVATGARIRGTGTVLVQARPRDEAIREFAFLSRNVEVHELKEMRARLQDAIEQLGRSNRRLSASNEELERYASMVSHDLRGPISAIQQFAQLLDVTDPPLGPDEAEMVAAIRRLSEQALTVAGSLLKLARAGSFDGVTEPADAAAALAAAAHQVGVDRADDVELVFGQLPPVWVHDTHLVQLFANLVGNALRYRDAERPLRIEVAAHEEDGWVRLVVSDDGPGIAEADRPRIFAPNVRGAAVRDRDGSGLGLALCRRVVTGYGGSIELLDDGPGAAFAFTLPAPPVTGES